MNAERHGQLLDTARRFVPQRVPGPCRASDLILHYTWDEGDRMGGKVYWLSWFICKIEVTWCTVQLHDWRCEWNRADETIWIGD